MTKLIDLQRDYEDLVTKQEELLKKSDDEKRDFTADETKDFDELSVKIRAIVPQIEAEKGKEEARARAAMLKVNTGQAKKSEEGKIQEKFSLLKMVRALASNKPLDGAELEVHQEAEAEATRQGRTISGFGLPGFMMRAGQDASTAATASNLIATELDSNFIPALRPKLVLSDLGATAMNGLVGNLDLPAGNGLATAAWETELSSANNTDPSTRLVSLRPNRLAAYTDVSKLLINQASQDVEGWVRSELSNAIARAVDTAGLIGNSGGIDGVIGTSGVNEISFSGAVTRAKLVNLISKIAVENADEGSMAFLMNPIIRGELQSLKTDAGSGLFVMNTPTDLLGYKALVSTLVPTNINTNHTAVIFGCWDGMVIGNWGGVEITVDPYTLATTGQIRIVVNSYWDIALKQPKAFAFGDDITYTTLS